MQLNDKVIIITGGCQGLGRSMAEYLAGKGAKLALVDLNQEKLDDAVAACKARGVEARSYLCNVANEEQVEHMVAQVAADFGAIHGLINNAGILRDGLLLKVKDGEMSKMSLAQWQAVIDVNLTGVFLCAREAAERMIRLGNGGAIINISSIMGLGGYWDRVAYCSSKAALINMGRVLALEWGPLGVRVNAVCPNFVITPLTEPLFAANPDFTEDVMRRTPTGRLPTPEEVSAAVVYLASPGAASVTGQALAVDGGWTAH